MNDPQRDTCGWHRQLWQRHWKRKPLTSPTVDPDLAQLSGLQRAAEVFRYTLLSLEWWLSPNGTLREWCKLNGKIWSVLLIPSVLVVPLVTVLLWQIATWLAFLVTIAGRLIVFTIAALVAFYVITIVVAHFRGRFRR